MTIEQIIALTQAGFSKYDILEMVSNNQMQPSTQQMRPSTQQMQPSTQQMHPSAQHMQMQPSTQPPYQQFSNGFYSYSGYPQNINQQISEQNDVLSALKNLTRSVQSNNINMMQNQMPKQVTTEDAIASIINPPNYEGLTDGGSK